MHIGFVTIYAHRPHVTQMAYLAQLLQSAGHRGFFLTCDSSVGACHNRLLKNASRLRECPGCMAGGLRSFPLGPVTSLTCGKRGNLPEERLMQLAASTAFRLELTESPEDCRNPAVGAIQRLLAPGVDAAYGSTKGWIRQRKLDAVLLYNGRMDLTRGVLEACRDSGVPFLAVEAPWTGHGIALTPNQMCLSTSEADRLVTEYGDAPLLESQAREAAQILARRFVRQNNLEWRVYNADARPAVWPESGTGEKVLILPSSRNEVEGHPDWACEWNDYTVAFDEVLSRLGVLPRNCVLRSHPNWAERLGQRAGGSSEGHYARWCERRGIARIASADKADTYDLLRAADLVLVNGSMTGIEAAALGKRVASVGHSFYQRAGFSVQCHTWADLEGLAEMSWPGANVIRRRALRYVYTYSGRLTQFVKFVRAESASRRRFYEGADPGRLVKALRTGRLDADDSRVSANEAAEDSVVSMMAGEEWPALAAWPTPTLPGPEIRVRRRAGLRWLDKARERLPVGDRM